VICREGDGRDGVAPSGRLWSNGIYRFCGLCGPLFEYPTPFIVGGDSL